IVAYNKTLPVAGWVSANQVVRPSRSKAETQPQLHPAFAEIVSDGFPAFCLERCSHHCLSLKTTPNDSEQHDGNDGSHSQEGFVEINLTYHQQLCRARRVFPL